MVLGSGWVGGVDVGQGSWEASLGAPAASHPPQASTPVPRGLVSREDIWTSGWSGGRRGSEK